MKANHSEATSINSDVTDQSQCSREDQQNLPTSKLVELAITRKEGTLTSDGALCVNTGMYTGRSPKDRFIVDEPLVRDQINWGTVNQPFQKDAFQNLYSKVMDYLKTVGTHIFDGTAGSDEKHQLAIQVITERAWHNLFAKQLFIEKRDTHIPPEFTVISAPGFKADPERDGTNSEAFVIISFEEKVILIGGTEYAGEIKKSVFSVLNYLLPQKNILPMHCSANVGNDGDVSLFFGLSGTGKTTLSADPKRMLIGDDEHAWSNNGVFNLEGGCYAKCIGLKKEKEPQIYDAIKFGTILENVVIDPFTGMPDYSDPSITENTRAAYPVEYISGNLQSGKAGHPNVMIFLVADAFGILPPVAKLTTEQAMYHFLSGYTSKLAGTERGISYPEATFSTCFGEPFMPLRPEVYDCMLGQKIKDHNVRTYLVNTGWTGGPYGIGERISLSYTRSIITAIQNKTIEKTSFHTDPVFNVYVPDKIPEVPSKILHPKQVWQDPELYDQKAKELVRQFHENFAKFTKAPREIASAGPVFL